MKCRREDTILLVVDYQEKLIPAICNHTELIAKTRILLEGARQLGIPILVSEQYPKGLGATVPEIQETAGDAAVYPKTSFSCWDDEGLRNAIEETGRNTVLVCGTETHICVLQSAIDLVNAGKQVLIVEDCVGSRFPHDIAVGLRRAEEEGVRISTTETVLFEMLRFSGTPEFKVISKLIK